MKPAISVVLPFFNAQIYIADAVQSVLRSTYENFELLMINNCSTDHSVDRIKQLMTRDSRIKLLSTAKPGIVSALNTGIAHARAPLVARMDADDIIDAQRLFLQKTTLDIHPDISLVSCLVKPLHATPLTEGTRSYLQWVNDCVSHEQIWQGLFIESPLPHPSVMFRKKVVEKLGGYREFDGPEDYELWLRMAQAGVRFHKIARPLLFWRIHHGSLSRQNLRYRRQAFYQCKFHHIGTMIQKSAVGTNRSIRIWGAGKNGARLCRILQDMGIPVDAFIDIDPRKIGMHRHGLPVLSMDWVDYAPQRCFYICAVGNWGAREKLKSFFEKKKMLHGEDYVLL